MHDRCDDVVADAQLFVPGLTERDHAGWSIPQIDRRLVATDGRHAAFDGLAGAQRPQRALIGGARQELFHGLGVDRHATEPRISGATHTIPKTEEEGQVNPTARWPERLEHLATLLRADALAVISETASGPATIFSHRLPKPIDWSAALGPDAFTRAERGAFTTPIAAGRWTESVAYAVVAAIDPNGGTILCGLRHDVPFDAIDAAAAAAAGDLLEMSASEGRALAETQRHSESLEERLLDAARRMGAGAASIMVVEGDELRLRASVGLPAGVDTRQRIGEGIAGWVAARGEKVVLRDPVHDKRFRGVDPDAREAIVIPLREGSDVLGVLNMKRPQTPDGFAERHELLDAIAADIAHALRSDAQEGASHAEFASQPVPRLREVTRDERERARALRVLAVEDHPVMRLGVRAMLEREGFVVAGTTATVGEAIGLLPDASADIVLLDLRLPDATGSEAVTRMREAATTLPIVAFSVDRTPGLIRAVLRAGANGYVTKDAPVSRIVAALRGASAGLVVMGPDEAIAAAAGVDPLPVESAERTTPATPPEPTNGGSETPHDPLTPRELELLRYMAEGYTNKEIARAMVLAEDTVKKAVQTLIAKLGAADRTHAVVLALRAHLIL